MGAMICTDDKSNVSEFEFKEGQLSHEEGDFGDPDSLRAFSSINLEQIRFATIEKNANRSKRLSKIVFTSL